MTYKLYGFINETQAREVDCLYLDGYSFGDRLLEGVIFQIRVAPDGENLEASVEGSDIKYLESLNAPKFLAEAAEAAKKIDTLSTTRQMHNDDGFVLKDGEEAPFDFELVD